MYAASNTNGRSPGRSAAVSAAAASALAARSKSMDAIESFPALRLRTAALRGGTVEMRPRELGGYGGD